jgi:multicomponent Na+:H+ antiporter subunit E
MRGRVVGSAWLTAVWVALWEDVRPGTIVAGLALSAVVMLIVPPRAASRRLTLRPLRALHFAAYFTYKLVEASALVTWEIVTPRNRIREGIVAVPIRGPNALLTTIVANSITLTPGTVTLEVTHEQPAVLYVHVLHLRDPEMVRRDIGHLELLVLRAFAPIPEEDT